MPITLAYARTIHKFQGLSAGPVDAGRTPNAYECIVCDPDDKQFEAGSIGLFYTALSRATTFGDENGLGSAIYFTGESMTEERFKHLKKKPKGSGNFELATHRDTWVKHLENQESKTLLSIDKNPEHIKAVIQWANTKKVSFDEFFKRKTEYCIYT